VLRPGGALHLVDIDATAPAHGWLARRASRHEQPHDSSGVSAPDLLRRAGFVDVSETGSEVRRHVGQVGFYRAVR
jgi:hypothetical protein